MNYWLMKSEPSTFGIDHLAARPKQTAAWDGVRNYQARNMMRDDMKVGDLAFFYHSNAIPPGIAGIMRITREAYPDVTQFDMASKYYDPKASPDNSRWVVVDVTLVEKWDIFLPLEQFKHEPGLSGMQVLRKGNRLSITPVTEEQWNIILSLK
ncbi:MAG: EVE domain-containing protein [Gammaproteobacteria bacterium]|nr:EVE domain-containing protein [Gammaproteobacteria bacterium]